MRLLPVIADGKKRRTWQSTECSIYAKANDDKLNVDNKTNLGNANDNYSGGLSVLGLCAVTKRAPMLSELSVYLLSQ